ncbi:MAG TPA: glycine cleavage system aminomethyltransferase GcvT [Candidatus Binatus sp.]|uniref:glycine cleavage system aminomethyltransferase GcvT n=1 Tax=Candidatus Binatus sp. TaxID=2811406 RepID=UPI002F42AC77
MNAPKRTVLFDLHQKLGARMTVFGGFEMPVSYSGIIDEHLAVRNSAGIFDLSHMGEFEISGPHALATLEHAFTNSAARLKQGQAQYTIMCAEDGGTIDDLIVYRVGPERYLLCVNASNIEADREWIVELNSGRAKFEDVSDATALIAVQGPVAVAILATLAEFPIADVARFGVAEGTVAGITCLAARTGYTGEDGFELFVDNAGARELFEAILDIGAAGNIKPVGLGARDTLRLEAGLPLYGHELDRNSSPLEAGLGTFVKLGRNFVGSTALTAQSKQGLKKRLIGLQTDDGKMVARQGYRLFRNGDEAGVVTSGTFAPSIQRPIAMAYFAGAGAKNPPQVGEPVEVEIRNRRTRATIVQRPFYRRDEGHAVSNASV